MSRRLGFLAALLVWLLLAGPAAAGIQRYTDSRGVIHISNSPPRQTKAIRGDGPALTPEPQAAPQVSEPAPSSVPVAQSLPAARSGAPLLPDNSDPTPARAAAHDSWQLPLKKAAVEMAGASQASPEEMRAAAPQAEVATTGGIKRYRDAAGVLHLTNLAPEAADSGPAIRQAEKRQSPGEASPAGQPGRAAAPDPGLPWRPASFSPGNPEPALSPAAVLPAGKAALDEGGGPIRRYRDRHGVIHINNTGPDEAPTRLEPDRMPVQAHLGNGKGRPPPGPNPSLEAWTAAAFTPASWSGEAVFKSANRLQAAAVPKDAMTSEGGIRRWRDKKGVWHIKTVEYPWPEGVPVPPRLAGLQAAPPLASSAPQLPRAATPALPAAPLGPGTSIIARRDSKGRLHITTERPPVSPEQAPPPGVTIVPAELEPLIAEAAQVHRLPPTLIKAVIKVESNFCSWAVSPKGAMGLMQLMPGTADLLGVREPFNPRENILGGCRYLRQLIDFFGGSVPLALAGYNAGYNRVVANGFQVPPIKETQEFVTQVMGRYLAAEKRLGLPWI